MASTLGLIGPGLGLVTTCFGRARATPIRGKQKAGRAVVSPAIGIASCTSGQASGASVEALEERGENPGRSVSTSPGRSVSDLTKTESPK